MSVLGFGGKLLDLFTTPALFAAEDKSLAPPLRPSSHWLDVSLATGVISHLFNVGEMSDSDPVSANA